jgi:RNA polymerase sigma factor (TIGR02999 family)
MIAAVSASEVIGPEFYCKLDSPRSSMSKSPEIPDHKITRLLSECRHGNDAAESELLALVYQELRQMARHHMSGEGPGHTLQTTALVHEAYLRLFGCDIDWQDRNHFFAVAAQMMRRVLVDHARARSASKRAGGIRVELGEAMLISEDQLENVLAVDQALNLLEQKDARQGKIVELHLFAGLTLEETAKLLGTSKRTVQRDWNFALAWLYDRIRLRR